MSVQNEWFVYILKCKDRSLYTGITNDLRKRFKDHKAGKGSKYVRSRKAVRIVYTQSFRKKGRALKREAELKRLSRQEKKELIKYHEIRSF